MQTTWITQFIEETVGKLEGSYVLQMIIEMSAFSY